MRLMLRPATTPPSLFTLVYLTALSVLSVNLFLPSLPGLARDFGVDYATAGFAVSGFLAITAVLQLIFGPLSDRYGRRPVLLVCLMVFLLASIGCTLTDSFTVFLICRVLQGSVAAAMALSRAIVRDTHAPQDAAAMLGLIGMAMAVAPMFGPAIGGILEELYGWRASFASFVILGTVGLILVWADLGETNTNRHGSFRAQFATYPELARSRRFWGYTLCLSFSIGAFYVYIAGIPALADTLGLTPSQTGFAIGAPPVGFFVGNFLTGRLTKRVPILTLAISGRVITVIGLVASLVMLLAGVPSVTSLIFGAVAVGLGNGLTVPTANAGLMSVRPHLAGSASGVSAAAVVAFGAVVSSIVAALLPAPNGELVLLGLLLVCGVGALVAALYVRHVDRAEAQLAA